MEEAAHKGKGARTLKNHTAALVSVFHSVSCRDPFEDGLWAKPVSSRSRMLMKPGFWISCLKNSVTFLQRKHYFIATSSLQFSHSVVSNSLRPHELQHARPPCPSTSPRVHSNSCPYSWWCHPAISSSVIPFSSCPQSLPASESFPTSQLFTWGGESTNSP